MKLITNKIFGSLLSCFALIATISTTATAATDGDTRSDSFDVQNYAIHLDITDFAGASIKGFTDVKIKSKVNNLNKLRLELYKLNVDSVTQKGKKINHTYNDSIVSIFPAPALSANDTFTVRVYYNGKPKRDPSGFGGFAFVNGYAFNLGIGFQADPHNYGRAWFPCVDNFTDRALFSFFITTQSTHKAFCGGLLKDSVKNTSGNWTWHWELNQLIPPYLASVAVGPYKTLKDKYTQNNHNLDIIWGVRPQDTASTKNAFSSLKSGLFSFENLYGPYKWDRVGYVYMPFSGGAMEHATNIAMVPAAFSSKAYETLWAHELSHHWWGDLVTCRTAEDMWINEGWASYSESLFTEALYGKKAFENYVRANHYNVLRYAHLMDNGYRAVSPLPHDYTYGRHAYWKGADMAHSLRGYLGDSLFFKGIQSFLDAYSFKDVSSEDFNKHLNLVTGKNLDNFFNDWIYQAGFTHIYFDSLAVNGNIVSVALGQQIKEADHLYKDIPVEITFFDKNWKSATRNIIVNNKASATITLPFEPVFEATNYDSKLSEAVTRETKIIKATGKQTFAESLIDINISAMPDSALLFVAHHWIGPADQNKVPAQFRISKERYWTIDGIWPEGFSADATIIYDGRKTQATSTLGNLDNNLLNTTEDSLRLLYREKPSDIWQEYTDYVVNKGPNKTDKFGNITIKKLRKGEYVFAMANPVSSIIENSSVASNLNHLIEVFPNPASEEINVRVLDINKKIQSLKLYDLSGKEVGNIKPKQEVNSYFLKTEKLKNGIYFLKVVSENGNLTKQVVVRK